MKADKQAYSQWTFIAFVQLLRLRVDLLYHVSKDWLSGQWAIKYWARED